jgi:hypothetical protein
MDATRDERFSTPGGLELPQSSTCPTHAGMGTQHSIILNPAAADSTSAAAAATFSQVSAVVGAIALFARAYGGSVVGDIVLEAARVLGHLGRGGREAGTPAPTYIRAVATVPPGQTLLPTAGASTLGGSVHRRPSGGGDAGAGFQRCLDCDRPASAPDARTRRMVEADTPGWVLPVRCCPCRAAHKAAYAAAAGNLSGQPSGQPTVQPTVQPSVRPSVQPSARPSVPPSAKLSFGAAFGEVFGARRRARGQSGAG